MSGEGQNDVMTEKKVVTIGSGGVRVAVEYRHGLSFC
jgi:hypothetical protein